MSNCILQVTTALIPIHLYSKFFSIDLKRHTSVNLSGSYTEGDPRTPNQNFGSGLRSGSSRDIIITIFQSMQAFSYLALNGIGVSQVALCSSFLPLNATRSAS